MPAIIIVDHEGSRSTVDLDPARRYTLGRSPRSDVALADPMLSRLHAELHAAGGEWHIDDRGSVNGVFVNGHRIEAATALADGDRVVVGGCVIRFVQDPDRRPVEMSDVPVSGMTVRISPAETVRSAFERTAPGAQEDPRQELENLRRLFQVVERANLELPAHEPLEHLLPKILDLVFEAVRPDRAALLLREGEEGLECRAFRGDAKGDDLSISRTLARTVMEEEVSLLTEDAQKDARFGRSASIGLQGIHAAMAVPLWTARKVEGLIYADSLGHQRFSEEDLKVLTMLANVAAVKMENHALFEAQVAARRIEAEARTAREIQLLLLPTETPRIPGYRFAGFNEPCHEIGGDYYGCASLAEHRQVLGIGDVAGKGIAAALVMAVLQATVQAVLHSSPDLPALVGHISRSIARSAPVNRFVTLFVIDLDSEGHRIRCINAGHAPAPVLVRAGGELRRFAASGPPLGPSPEFAYRVEEAELAPGEFLFACTDGITEATGGDGEVFGDERLDEVLRGCAGRPPEAVQERVLAAVREHCGGDPSDDDLTMITLQRSPA